MREFKGEIGSADRPTVTRKRTSVLALVVICLLAFSTAAQWDKKPPSAWSASEINRLLTDSPWSRTYNIAAMADRDQRPPPDLCRIGSPHRHPNRAG
jgi:hypothetical protein